MNETQTRTPTLRPEFRPQRQNATRLNQQQVQRQRNQMEEMEQRASLHQQGPEPHQENPRPEEIPQQQQIQEQELPLNIHQDIHGTGPVAAILDEGHSDAESESSSINEEIEELRFDPRRFYTKELKHGKEVIDLLEDGLVPPWNIEKEEILEERRKLLEELGPFVEQDEREIVEGMLLPLMTKSMRKRIHKPITNLFENEIIPLLARTTPMAREEEIEDDIFRAVNARINVKIREVLWEQIKPPQQKKGTIRKKNKNLEEIIGKMECITEFGSVISNLLTLNTALEDNVDRNEYNQQLEKATRIIIDLPEELQMLVKRTLGAYEEEEIAGALNDTFLDNDRGAKFVNWIDDELAMVTAVHGQAQTRYKSWVQSQYNEDPKKTFNRFIDPNIGTECEAEIDQVMEHFSRQYADRGIYMEAEQGSKWRLCQQIDKPNNDSIILGALELEPYIGAIKS